MRKWLVACLGASTLGGMAVAQVPGRSTGPTGVLVGVVHPVSDPAGSRAPVPATLQTLWFETSRGTVADAPHLLVPRSSGFWRIQLVHFCREEPDEDFEGKPLGDALDIDEELWAYSLDAPPNVPTGAACKSTNVHCANARVKHLFWVWPDFVSMQDFFEVPGCGASMFSSLDFSVQRLEELDGHVTLTAALGRGAEQRMKSAFDKAKLEEAAGQGPDCVKETTFDTTSWHITRAAGEWRLEGWANTHRNCGVGFEYTADVDLSPVTGRMTSPPASWKGVPGAKDALASPDGRWLLIVSPRQVHLVRSNALQQPIATAALSDDDSVVMAEWASGANVPRWRRQVRALAAQR